MASLLLFLPCALIAQGIYTGLVGMISATTIKTCSIIKTVYNLKNPNVIKIVQEMDLETRLRIIQTVINKINTISKPKLVHFKLNDVEKTQIFELIGTESIDLSKDPIEVCLESIHEVIQFIHNDLNIIYSKINLHQTKWFHKWRSMNTKDLTKDLEIHSTLLNSRFDNLVKVATFLNHKVG